MWRKYTCTYMLSFLDYIIAMATGLKFRIYSVVFRRGNQGWNEHRSSTNESMSMIKVRRASIRRRYKA